jgi:hypothetical protein
MSKTRLFELAAKLGHTPEELRDELNKRGKPAKSNLSLLEAVQVDELTAHFSGSAPKKAVAAPAKTVAVRVAASEGSKAESKPVLRAGLGGVVRVAPPKLAKKVEAPKAPEIEAPAEEAKPKEGPQAKAPLTTVVTSLPPKPETPTKP